MLPFSSIVGRNRRTAIMGIVLLGIAASLLFAHARFIRSMRVSGLPAAVAIPPLEKRLMVLREQMEVSEVQHALSGTEPR